MAARLIPEGEITKEVISSLVQSGIMEGQMIDFKSSIDVTTSKAKRDLAGDVAAFANASGGDILFGVKETEGRASGVLPLAILMKTLFSCSSAKFLTRMLTLPFRVFDLFPSK